MDYWKINVDAAWIPSIPTTGIGVIFRNSNGEAIAASTISLDANIGAPLFALRAIYEGMVFAKSMGCSKW